MTKSEWLNKKKKELSNPIVHKKISNTFIHNTIHNSTLSALKITYYLSTILKNFDYSENINTIILDTKKMLDYTNLSLKDLKNNFKKLQETSITFINEKQDWEEYIVLIPRIKFHIGRSKKIEIDIYSKIAKLIIEVVNNYTFIDTKELMKLKNKHSVRILPLLKTINGYDIKQKTFSLSDLNEFFDTNYKRFTDIERYVILKIKKELDDNSKLTFEYEMKFESLGKGRPSITGVIIKPKFLNQKKDINIKSNSTIIDDNKINQIKKIKDWKPNKDLIDSLPVEYGIAQTGNESLIYEFELYLEEQVIVFKKYCIENKKNYKDMDISFKRHIEGAFNNKIDFFSKNGFN